MRTRAGALGVVLFLLLVLPAVTGVSAAEDKPLATVRGEVLDLACYVGKGAKGPDHAKCALSCLKSGQPMGLVAADGKVYLLYANHADASAFEKTKALAGKQVEIQGRLAAREGINGLEVQSVKEI